MLSDEFLDAARFPEVRWVVSEFGGDLATRDIARQRRAHDPRPHAAGRGDGPDRPARRRAAEPREPRRHRAGRGRRSPRLRPGLAGAAARAAASRSATTSRSRPSWSSSRTSRAAPHARVTPCVGRGMHVCHAQVGPRRGVVARGALVGRGMHVCHAQVAPRLRWWCRGGGGGARGDAWVSSVAGPGERPAGGLRRARTASTSRPTERAMTVLGAGSRLRASRQQWRRTAAVTRALAPRRPRGSSSDDAPVRRLPPPHGHGARARLRRRADGLGHVRGAPGPRLHRALARGPPAPARRHVAAAPPPSPSCAAAGGR